jgi:hypothetical protein
MQMDNAICFTNNGTKQLLQILKVHAVVLFLLLQRTNCSRAKGIIGVKYTDRVGAFTKTVTVTSDGQATKILTIRCCFS